MFFLKGLHRGLSVLIVEKGQIISHQDLLAGQRGPAGDFHQNNHSNREKVWVTSSVFGGNSNCWWGQTPRFHPDDFRTNTLFGFAEDWPFEYADLEPFYSEVEQIMEIAGGGDEHILPRSAPYPFPPHTGSRSDKRLQQNDMFWIPAAAARSNGGSRPTCCANGVCHLCPVDAKFTILNSADKFARPGVYLLPGTEVLEIRHTAGTARSIMVQTRGEEWEIPAKNIALGANAIFNAAILLRSGFKAPSLGRYLHEQVAIEVQIDTPIKNLFGGTSITGLGYHFYHDFDRRAQAAVLIQNYNVPAATRPVKDRWTERITLKLVAEDIPDARNRVVLGKGKPVIEWYGHSNYSRAGLSYAQKHLSSIIPANIESVRITLEPPTEAHIQGTTRIGSSLEAGVVDGTLRAHEVSNVWCLGAGAFPSCSPANPTLTLSALSLRAARMLI